MKMINKILCASMLMVPFALTGCKKKPSHNEKISNKKLNDIIHSIATDRDFCFPENDTFTVDPSDSNYEIGYAFISGRGLDFLELSQEDDYEISYSEMSNYPMGIEHRLIRREISTKTIDEDYFPTVENNGKTWYIRSKSTNLDYTSDRVIYEQYEPNSGSVTKVEEVDNDNFFELTPFDIYVLPESYFKYEKTGEDSKVYYKNLEGNWIDMDESGNSSISTSVDFLMTNYNGEDRTYISFSTIFKLALKEAKKEA